jgi:pimeloyl-ACP methyl ester carboxylesterase
VFEALRAPSQLGETVRRYLLALTVAMLAGCQSAGRFTAERRAPSCPSVAPAGIVLVADGAGDYRDLSHHLNDIVGETSTPLHVETIAWSHGYRRIVADQVDHDNHRAHAQRLAAYVLGYRQAHPSRAVYFVGMSAGCEVLLSAAELLPPDSIDRIVLLAPSVCAYRDLRPALRTTAGGIDVFSSHKDRLVLGLGTTVTGTTEGGCRAAAGRTGFRPVVTSPDDAALYQRLRQYPWQPSQRAYGNDGGHFGSTQPDFLRSHVVPLLTRCR